MGYTRIATPAELAERVVPGQPSEDDYLEFKGDPWPPNDAGRRECARDVAQFANASGGTLIAGAPEQDHVLQGFNAVPEPDDLIHWVGDVLNGQLEPVPPVEPHVVTAPNGAQVVTINVPPSPMLIARKTGEGYEFAIRAGAAKRYMTLMEVEARMGNHERLMKLRLQQVHPGGAVVVDAQLHGTNPNNWALQGVTDHTVTLAKGALTVEVPLSYVEAVYHTAEPGGPWVVALDCHILHIPGADEHLRVRRFNP